MSIQDDSIDVSLNAGTLHYDADVGKIIDKLDLVDKEVARVAKTMQSVLNGHQMQQYWKSQEELIRSATDAMASFRRAQEFGTDNEIRAQAEELLKIINALQATAQEGVTVKVNGFGIDELKRQLLGLEEEYKTNFGTIEQIFSPQNFRDAFIVFDELKAKGIDVSESFSRIGGAALQGLREQNEELVAEKEQLEETIQELRDALSETDYSKLKQLQDELEATRSKLKELAIAYRDEFSNWLLGVGFDPDTVKKAMQKMDPDSMGTNQAGRDMAALFKQIENGSIVAGQAISKFATKYADTIEAMSGKPIGETIGNTAPISEMMAVLGELKTSVSDLSTRIREEVGGAVEQAAQKGAVAAASAEQTLSNVNPSAFGGVLQLIKDLIQQSGEFSEGMTVSKNAAIELLDTLGQIANADSKKLSDTAVSLQSLHQVLDKLGSGVQTTGLTSIANFIKRVSEEANPGRLASLSNIKLDGFKDVKASKTLNNLADFITKVTGAGAIPDLAPLIGSLRSISGISISRGFNGVSATLSELSKITTGKKFANLQNLKLKDVFDMAGVEGNLTLFKELVSNAEKYADALQLISKYQGSVGKMAAGSSGTAIGTVVREIEAAKAELDKQFTDDAAIRSTTEAMWREYDQARSSVEKLGAAAKDAATPVKELSSSWVGSQSQQALADIERETDAYMELAAAEEQALEAKLAAAEQKEIAAWDKAADKEYAKEVADAFRDLERATKAYYDARVEQAKYTGTDQTVIRQLQEAVELTERQKAAAEQKAQAYRDDEAAAEAAASAEAKLAAIQSKMESKLSTMADKQAKSETSENEGFAKSMQRAWEVARNALQLYRKELEGTTNGPVQDLLRTLEELTAQFNEARGLNSFGEEDKQSYSGLTDTLSDVIEKLRIAREELSQVGGTTSSIEAAKSAMQSLRLEISSVSSSANEWKGKLGADNQFSAQAEEILARLSGLAGEMERDGLSADDLRSRLQTLKVEFSDLSIRAKEAMANANFVQGSKEQANALDQVSKAITDLDTKMANMGSARNGKTAGNYQELVRLRAEYEILQKAIQSCSTSEDAFKTKMSQLATEVRQNIAAIQIAGEATKTFGERILEVAGKLSSWISPMRIVMYVIRTFKQMVSTSIELDSAMAQLRVVTGASSAELEKFGDSAAKTAAQIGASIKDLIDSTTVFSRLGYSLDESSMLAKYTAMLKQVGDIDISDAQNAVTAITKAFSDEIQIDDIESVMDRLVIVGNNFPISVEQIATGMNNASSALAAAGNTFEQTVALLTAANSVVQNAAKSSTGLRTIAARIRNTKAELDDLGEAMTSAKYEELVKGLTKLHVSLVDANGEYRSTYDIISDIADKWEEMSSMEQAALATNIAGTRQQEILYSMIHNFQEASGAMEAMKDSAGTMSSAYDEYLDSIQAHLDQFKAKFQEFGSNLIDKKSVTGLIDLGSGLMSVVGWVGKVINMLGGLRVAIVAVTGALAGLNAAQTRKNLQNTYANIEALIPKILATKAADDGLTASVTALTAKEREYLLTQLEKDTEYQKLDAEQKKQILNNVGLGASIQSAGASAQKASVSFKALWSGMSVIGKISAVLSVISFAATLLQITGLGEAIKDLFKSTDTRIEETKQKIGQLSSEINSISTNFRNLKKSADEVFPRLIELSAGVDKLGNKVDLTDKEYDEFLELNNRLAEMFPELNLGMDDNGNAMLALSYSADTLKTSLDELLKKQRELADHELADKFGDQLDLVAEQVGNYQDKIDGFTNSPESATEIDALEAMLERIRKVANGDFAAGEFGFVEEWRDALDKLIGSDRYTIQPNGAGILSIIINPDDIDNSLTYAEAAYANYLASIEKETEYTKGQITDTFASLIPGMIAITRQQGAFDQLSEGLQDIVIGLVKGIDVGAVYEELNADGSVTTDEVTQYILKNIIFPIQNADGDVKEAFAKLFDLSEAVKSGEMSAEEYAEQIKGVFQSVFDSGYETRDNAIISWLNAIGVEGTTVEEVLLSLAAAFSTTGTNAGLAGADLEGFADTLKNLKTATDILTKAEEEMAKNGGLSPDTIASMAAATDNYLDYLYQENGVIKLNTDAWKEYMTQAAKSRVAALETERDRIKGEIDEAYSQMPKTGGGVRGLTSVLSAPIVDKESAARIAELQQSLDKVNTEIAVAQGSVDYYLNKTDDTLSSAISNVKSYYDILRKAEEEMKSGFGISEDTVKSLMGATDNWRDYVTEENGILVLNMEMWKEFADAPLKAVEASRDALVAERAEIGEAYEAVQSYQAELEAAKALGVDTAQTTFGNIDTSVREAFEWTEDKLKQYETIIRSWGINPSELLGTTSTVLGTSGEYNGIEIAYTLMMQTDNGLVPLNQNTIDNYIFELLSRLESEGKEWNLGNILALDAEGLVIDGQKVRGIIADIGETAQHTSEIMHFSGPAGALAGGLSEVKKYADAAGMSVDEFADYVVGLDGDIDEANQRLDFFRAALRAIVDESSNLTDTQRSIKELSESMSGLETLGKIYDDVKNGSDFDFSSLISDDFVNAFSQCGEAYEAFIEIISKSPKDIEACQDAFDNLATTYILNSGILDNLTEETRDETAALLEQNGVANAAEIVDGQLALQKQLLAAASSEHANNMLAEIANSSTLANASENVRAVLARTALAKLDVNKNTIKTRADIDNLQSLASAANASISTINRLAKVKKLIEQMDEIKPGNGMSGRERAAALAAMQAEINSLLNQGIDYSPVSFGGGNAVFTGGGSSSSGGSGSSGSSGSGSSSKTETWFEQQIRRHQHLVNMDKETLTEYTNWLDTAFRRAYQEGILSLDDFNKYEEEVYENRQQIFEDKIDQLERTLEQRIAAGANPNSIVVGWRNILNKLEAEIQRYLDAGYSRTDEVVQNLIDRAAEVRSNIVEEANNALDGIQNVYQTLTNAENEYNNSGYLSVDTYQAILELGPKYLQYLKNENGELEVNEKAIQKVMKLRIKELAIDQALMYAKEIYNASVEKNTNLLWDLTAVQERQTGASWDLVESTIAQARAIGQANGIASSYYDNALNYIQSIRELSELTSSTLADSLREGSDSSNGQTWFERQYQQHQHMLNMQQESSQTFFGWLNSAYRQAYQEGIITEEDLLRYEEELFRLRQSAFSEYISYVQTEVDRLAETGLGDDKIEQRWRDVLERCDIELQWYLQHGYDTRDEVVQNILGTMATVRDNLRELFQAGISDMEFGIDEQTVLGADPNVLVGAWRSVLGKLQDELKRYIDEGYSVNSDVVQDLIQQIRDASGQIISIANDAVDGVQDAYTTLTNAAKEWATTGYLSVDSYQAILELGPKYMSMLMDENGHLQVNEKQLQKVLAVRVKELAIDQAMVYARQVLAAAERKDADALAALTVINDAQTASTWELVTATLSLARAIGAANGMQESYFDNAQEYINRLRQLSVTTTSTIAESYMTLNEGYINQADALEEIINYTKELIKWENEQHIKAIEDEVEAYRKIVDQKKESLRLSKEQDDHDRDVADKVDEIAKLQARIDQLSLDDSREARAQRAALEEELAQKQRDLADSQSDYAYNQQIDALDKEFAAFEKEKDDEIKTLQDMYQSEEQLYNAAITRIRNGWESLYRQLIGWNTNYGNTLNDTITAAWNQAAAAVQRYGSFLDALEGVQSHIDLGPSSSTRDLIFAKMRENSLQWFVSDAAGRRALHADNEALAQQYFAATGSSLQFRNNTWYDEYGMRVYEFTKEEIARTIVSAMKQNAAAWGSADKATREILSQMNQTLAERLETLLGQKIERRSGVWYIGNKRLFDVYHAGGIAGNMPTLKQNEVLAVLEKGEAILDKRREESLYKIVDFIKVLSDKLGSAIDMSRLSPAVFGGFRVRPSSISGDTPFNINNASFNTSVSVQIQHSGAYSKEDATKFGKQVADATISKINEAFTKRGVPGIGSAFLKS